MTKARKLVKGPLTGIRILDFSRLYPGPLGTMMLADMGAEVIKIEDPTAPDPMRSYPPFLGSESAGYLAVNRSKRSLSINLKHAQGREILEKLLKSSDLVVESFRPGVLDHQGLGYSAAQKINPKIIYVSVTGYGQTGPYANRASHDINYLAYSGLLAITGNRDSGPIVPGAQIADVAGGAYMTVIACLSALWARERTGKGQHVDVSMLDGTLPLLTLQFSHYWATGENPARGKTLLTGHLACYGVYPCADGKYISLAALEPKFWNSFCEFANRRDWIEKQFAPGKAQEQLREDLRTFFKSKPRDEWITLAADKDICLAPVLEFPEVEKDPHLRSRNIFMEIPNIKSSLTKELGVPVKFSRTPAHSAWGAPALGEDSVTILKELGYSPEKIEVLLKKGVITSRQGLDSNRNR